MKKISFESVGSLTATFFAQEGVADGQVVKVTGSGTVGPCQVGDAFCGVAGMPRNGAVGVQLGGFVTVSATLPLNVGKVALSADGKGGIKADENGNVMLVVDVDTVANTAVICL